MAGPPRSNTPYVVKTLRFTPEMANDMEKVMFFTMDGDKLKYPSLTNLVTTALRNLIRKERRRAEQEGVAWDHLKPGFSKTTTKEKDNG